ncbi:MAG: hypothetical protein C0506_08020 [Anaerolinea sp.]|nr:hypothetical protein [Anaerolinea sp.]
MARLNNEMLKRFIQSPVVWYAPASTLEGTPVNGRRSSHSRLQANELTPDRLRDLVCELLDAAKLTPEEKVQLLGGAFVVEAVRPFTGDGGAGQAHLRLQAHDPELAAAVESLAPMIYGRARAAADATAAIAAVEELLR